MALLTQSAAYTRTFLMVLSTDHVSPATGKTVTVNISKAGAAFGTATNTPATEIANGWYKIALTAADTGTVGDLSFNCTASGSDNTDFADQVVSWLDQTLGVKIQVAVKKNIALNNFPFVMLNTAGNPQTGLTVTPTRSIDGGAFAAGTLSAVTEIDNGWYTVNLGSGDLNGTNIALRFTAASARDTDILLVTSV